MAHLVDRVVETTQTTGTGTLDLLGASTGFRSFSDGLTSGDQVFYAIDDDPSAPTVWEYGIGTWTSGSPAQLSRDEVLGSSNGGSKISLQSGTTYTVTGVLAVRALQDAGWAWLTAVAGTNTVTASAHPALTSYKAGQTFAFAAAGANTGAATLDIDSLGLKAIKKAGASGLADLVSGDIQAGHVATVVYDGTQFVMTSPVPTPANIAVTDAANIFTADQTIRSSDAGSGAGPLLTLERASASPAANDALGNVIVSGRDGAGNVTTYAYLRSFLLDPTNGSEDADIRIGTSVAGTASDRVTVTAGVQVGAPTGGDKGSGSLNAVQLYEAGARAMTKADALAPKAWGKIGVSAGTYSLTTGAGMGSVLKNATGDITVSWSTAFSTADYAVNFQIYASSGVWSTRITSQLAGSVRIQITDNAGTLTDPAGLSVTAFGVQ